MDFKGFIERLRDVPDDVVEAKQREIERVRHLLLYDVSGTHEDAFSAMLRQTVQMLADLPRDSSTASPSPLKRPDRRPPFGKWRDRASSSSRVAEIGAA